MPKIVLLTRQVCPICDEVKQWLRNRDIPFTEYEIGTEAASELLMQVIPPPAMLPVCFIDGTFIGGKIEMFRWTVSFVKQQKESQ